MSEENDQGAPDGDQGNARADGNDELAKVIEQRDQHKGVAREREQQIADRDEQLAAVRAELAQLKKPTGAAAGVPDADAPAWAQKVLEQVSQLEQRISGGAAKTARDGLMTQVLNGVPDGNRQSAELTILGLEAKGYIKLDADGSADAVNAAIHKHNPNLFRDGRRRVRLPPPLSASGEIDWGMYNSITEVPKKLLGSCPDADWERLNNAGAGAGKKPLRL